MLLSGGIDSAACVDFYIKLGRKICGLFVDYGQPSAKYEAIASKEIAKHYSIPLLNTTWKGPSPKTSGFINGRNGFFTMAALMERPATITVISMGIHSGTTYEDCSQSFINSMQKIVDIYERGNIHLSAPFVDFTKNEILSYCINNNVPVDLTYSCENGIPSTCGRCLSCKDREMLNAC